MDFIVNNTTTIKDFVRQGIFVTHMKFGQPYEYEKFTGVSDGRKIKGEICLADDNIYNLEYTLNLAVIKQGDMIDCRPTHVRGGNRRCDRRVTKVVKEPHKWQLSGVAVSAHGYNEYWLNNKEIFELTEQI
jgi:hypothetical protein